MIFLETELAFTLKSCLKYILREKNCCCKYKICKGFFGNNLKISILTISSREIYDSATTLKRANCSCELQFYNRWEVYAILSTYIDWSPAFLMFSWYHEKVRNSPENIRISHDFIRNHLKNLMRKWENLTF